LPAFRPRFLVTGFALLLRSAGCGTVIATLVAPRHALRLRGRRRNASEDHDASEDTNASQKTHFSLHAVSPLVRRSFASQTIEQESKPGAGTNLLRESRGRISDFGLVGAELFAEYSSGFTW
jgi:hypothetical protein